MAEPDRLPAGAEALAAALRARQRANGAFLAGDGRAPLAAGAWAAWALDLAGEGERARAFHLWAGRLLRRAAEGAGGGSGRTGGAWLPSAYRLAPGGRGGPEAGGLAGAAATGTWLWTLARHLERHGLAAVPGRLAQPVRAAVTALLELAGALPEGEEEPAGVAAAERAAALAAVFAGLNAMDRWFALAPLAGRLVRLWKEVSAAVEAAAAAVLPAAVRAPLLVAGVPFDVVDPRGAAYRALLERQLGESPAGRRDAVGLALEAWALLCAGRPEAAEERRGRLGELEPAGEEGLAALALALVAERARSGGGLCP